MIRLFEYIILSLITIIILLLILINCFKAYNLEKIITKAFKIADISLIYDNFNNNYQNDNIIFINDKKKFFNSIINKGSLGFGESYINNIWNCQNLYNIAQKILNNYDKIYYYLKPYSVYLIFYDIKRKFMMFLPNNTIESSKKNISSHYDIGNDLYHKMLGSTMQYTCAYFYQDNLSLDQAQKAKMNLIAKKLDLKPGMKVIDIGCGFGAMAQFLAIKFDVTVLGVTLSKEQKIYADQHFKHPKVTILVQDYRHVKGKFDRVYSVGTFEHIARKNYQTYFNKCDSILNDNGIMLLHTIGSSKINGGEDPFIEKYIFPEGQLPHVQNIANHKIMKNWNLEDMQNFGLSYSKTLRAWKKNIGNWSGLENYNFKFRRMWEYYLTGCAAAFQVRNIYLWQFVFTKKNTQLISDLHYIRKC